MTDFIICRARSVSPLTADSPVCSLPQILEQPVIQVVTFTWNSQLYFLPESGTVSYPDIHSGAAVIWVIFTWNSQSLGIIPGAASNPGGCSSYRYDDDDLSGAWCSFRFWTYQCTLKYSPRLMIAV